ncbi:MAG: phasin family protein [Alphaproteobacteria bacterium]|nr:phasin family protein [Alphaproteobacteria bacterium]
MAKETKSKKAEAKSKDSHHSAPKDSTHSSHKESHHSSHAHTNPAAEMFKTFAENLRKPKVDREAMMENHRKNIEAMNDANKMAMEVIKTIAQLQSQYVKQTFEEMNSALREMMSVKKPEVENKWETHASKIKDAMTKAIDHTASIANVVVKSHRDMHGKMQDRFAEGMDHMKESASKYKN